MKKLYGLLVVVFAVVLLTGCGGSKNGFKCTAKLEENGESAEVEFDVKLDDAEKVKTVDVTFAFESEDYANQMYTMYEWYNSMVEEDQKIDVSKSGKKITIKNYEKIQSDEDEEGSMGNIVGLTKDEFKKSLEEVETATSVSCK